jgi:hypothetical protein
MLIPAFLLGAVVHAESIRIAASLTPQPVAVGDRVTLTAVFTTSPGIHLAPAFSATSLGEWEVFGIRALPTKPAGAELEQSFELVMTCWSATATATPELAFAASLPPAAPHRIVVAPFKVTMRSVLAGAKDTGEMKAPKGMIEFRSWWPWIMGGLAVLLAVAGWWLWRRRVARAAGLAEPVLPPEISAREALDQLLASSLLEEGQVKKFYSELSDVLRRYLERRFGIPALDRTTAELLPELRQQADLRHLFAELRVFLENGDLVKFARLVPDRAEIDGDVGRVRQVIDATAPRPVPVAPVAAAS